MNLNNSDIKRAFSDDPTMLEDLHTALVHDKVIIPSLIKILNSRLSGVEFSLSELEHVNYSHIRDIRTGREHELKKLLNKLVEPNQPAKVNKKKE